MSVRVAAALSLLLSTGPVRVAAQAVMGRVMDATSDRPISAVVVELLAEDGSRVSSAITDNAGAYRLTAPAPGAFSIATHHIAFENFISPPFMLVTGEPRVLDIDLGPSVVAMDRIEVRVRLPREAYHAPTYSGLYARMRALGTFGHNRVVMKDDVEFRSAIRARDLLRHWFPSIFDPGLNRGCMPDVYWHGAPLNPSWHGIMLDTSVEDLEAIEVYEDFLMAPMPFRGANMILGGIPCAVVVLWPLRPDLPGRGEGGG